MPPPSLLWKAQSQVVLLIGDGNTLIWWGDTTGDIQAHLTLTTAHYLVAKDRVMENDPTAAQGAVELETVDANVRTVSIRQGKEMTGTR